MEWTRMMPGENGTMLVVSQAEGVRLGSLAGAYLDDESRALSALVCRRERANLVIHMEAVALLGQDVILVRTEADAEAIGDGQEPGGRDLRTLVGIPVTTRAGQRLGYVEDAKFDPSSGSLATLLLHDGRALDVDAGELTIGRDELLVPAEYAERVRDAPFREVGLISRMAALHVREAVTGVVRRITGRSPRQHGARSRPDTTATGH